MDAHSVRAWASCSAQELQTLATTWDDLPLDPHLKDGGHYRRRRHASYVVQAGQAQLAPHRAHWQPLAYNALHGGIHRWFEPVQAQTLAQPAWTLLLLALTALADQLRGVRPWYVEAHQFRIDTAGGIGRPTPEGAHRDGVDFVAVFLLARLGIKGGETRVFDVDSPHGQRFTLTQPWSALVMDDTRVIHESTPIQALQPDAAGAGAYRDTLVLTCRSGGFLEPV